MILSDHIRLLFSKWCDKSRGASGKQKVIKVCERYPDVRLLCEKGCAFELVCLAIFPNHI